MENDYLARNRSAYPKLMRGIARVNPVAGRFGYDDPSYMLARRSSPAPAPAHQRGIARQPVTPYQGSLKSQFDQALGFDQHIPPQQAMATAQEGNARLNALYNRSLGLQRV